MEEEEEEEEEKEEEDEDYLKLGILSFLTVSKIKTRK